ncbi:MAG: hypothetical protein V3S42_02970 [Candidatus Neomarinimicrobiota bacterium]
MIKVDKDECDFCGACVAAWPADCTEYKLFIYVYPIEVVSYVEHETV